MPAPEISLIVPAYNEAELLPATLARLAECLAALAPRQGEIVVVDNDSTDGTGELARAAGARVVHEAHRQIARARNVGARHSQGRYLVFVDADTLITPSLLRLAIETLDGGAIAYGGTPVRFDEPGGWHVRLLTGFWNSLSRCFTWPCGAFIFCRRDAFETIGGFDERYYASEEIHLAKALRRWSRRHGYRGRILGEPILTSNRKARWFSVWRLLGMLVRFALWPGSIRRREHCWMWYERPAGATSRRQPLAPGPGQVAQHPEEHHADGHGQPPAP
jgi:glycosyltransferase involved in cell wall biosynthesis